MFVGFEGIAYAHSLTLLKACIFIFGLGGGIINGATNAVVADISAEKKAANLSLLGVFFGIGALGMPLVLAWLSEGFHPLQIVAVVGWLTLVVALFYAFVSFPPAKQKANKTSAGWEKLFQWLLLLIAFFLFFQSSFEAIINKVYFVSDAGVNKRRNIWVYDTDKKSQEQITEFKDIDINHMSAGPDEIVFEAGGRLYLLNLSGNKYSEVKINVVADMSTLMPRTVTVGNNISNFDLSPDAKRSVFEARGDLFAPPFA